MKQFKINNRKYIGAKHRLLDFIENTILDSAGPFDIFIDGFAGTGAVARRFTKHARHIISNDLLYSNYIVNKSFIASDPNEVDLDKIRGYLTILNDLSPIKGYCYDNFGGKYFSYENAGSIDAVRNAIESYFIEKKCTLQEYYILLTSLLYAADKGANTVGQYDAYLKNLENRDKGSGKHLVDSNVLKPLTLHMPEIHFSSRNRVYNEDINTIIHEFQGDVVYLDPPYNTRQYIDCYHVLENIARWEKPPVFGKTKKFKRGHLKSRYSEKRNACKAFNDLIGKINSKHIFLSYNDEGVIPDQTILDILGTKGTVKVFQEDYPVFGNGAGKANRRTVKERLFYCRVKN